MQKLAADGAEAAELGAVEGSVARFADALLGLDASLQKEMKKGYVTEVLWHRRDECLTWPRSL